MATAQYTFFRISWPSRFSTITIYALCWMYFAVRVYTTNGDFPSAFQPQLKAAQHSYGYQKICSNSAIPSRSRSLECPTGMQTFARPSRDPHHPDPNQWRPKNKESADTARHLLISLVTSPRAHNTATALRRHHVNEGLIEMTNWSCQRHADIR